MIRTILTAQEMESSHQVDAANLRGWLAAGEPVRFIDVRMPDEVAATPCAEAEPLDYDDSGKYMGLPKDTRIVFACATGDRSLDVAAYFAGHGFEQAFALRGGLGAWSTAALAGRS